jgi:hypothetical protein
MSFFYSFSKRQLNEYTSRNYGFPNACSLYIITIYRNKNRAIGLRVATVPYFTFFPLPVAPAAAAVQCMLSVESSYFFYLAANA